MWNGSRSTDQRITGDNRLMTPKSSYRWSRLASISMSTHHILDLKKVPRGELRGANPSTRGMGWANLWCTSFYANSSTGLLSWYGRAAAPREILLYTSSRMRFLNKTSIGERCKHREV
ncbi:hypothetical protein TanjilG_22677 [Lupinus angustifolius]|uniref:Uncharacterized protein n=1 Tax=Lupinus angustifolius TaxID=3871 RepID=A0A1J7GK70_LUPAN|nr:hypothetical protein TanjilG_22677 [Lupinus angustifolius]